MDINWNEVATLVTAISTAIYVFITVLILAQNKKTADAAAAQIKEMQDEHKETTRFDALPFLQAEPVKNPLEQPQYSMEINLAKEGHKKKVTASFRLKNVGNGTACNITLDCVTLKGELIRDTQQLPINAIRSGEQYAFDVYLGINADAKSEDLTIAIRFLFNDLFSNVYNQYIYINFEEYTVCTTIDLKGSRSKNEPVKEIRVKNYRCTCPQLNEGHTKEYKSMTAPMF